MKLFTRLRDDIPAEWEAYTRHEFVRGLGDGSLPQASFRHYLTQDYLFLIQFARAYALAIYKAPNVALMRDCLAGLKAILESETQLHLTLCGEWGLSPAEVGNMPESMATIAYTRFVLDAGQSGDLLDLFTALAPCTVGYAQIGERLVKSPTALADSNPYRAWIGEYSSDAYQQVARNAGDLLDRLADVSLTEARYPRLLALFRQATRLEAGFWQMGLDLSN